MTSAKTILSTLTLLAAFLPAYLRAQPEGDEDGPARRRLEEYRRIKLIEFVELNEDQAIRYFARERELRQAERASTYQRQLVLRRLRDFGKSSPTEIEVQKEIQALADIAAEITDRRKDFAAGLKDFLSPRQMARLIVFEDNFSREVRRIIQDIRKGGRHSR